MDQKEELLIAPKKHEKVVYIFNLSEDVWPFIASMSDEKAKRYEIEENAFLVDRDLFSVAEENELLLISPMPINTAFLDYYKELMGIRTIRILVPKTHTGLICEDIIADESIMQTLVEEANSVRKLTLTSYSASLQFFRLIAILKEKGITVYTPESPDEECAWTVNFFGSKSGIRQLGQQSSAQEPDFKLAEGLICVSVFDAAKIAAHKYIKEDGVVIKTNKGHSGAGVLIFRPGDLPREYRECEQAIQKELKKDAYWEKFPIIIESLLNVNQAVAGGFPNVEFKIQKSGKIDLLYYCGMRVTPEGVFKGIEIHDDIISERVTARIIDTGFFIAEKYAAAGYRGYFDVDYVAAKNGEMYVTESNTRRTGGTHVYKTALELVGKDFLRDSYVLSNNAYMLSNGIKPSFEKMYELLKPILFQKSTKEGVVLISSNLLEQSKLAYIIFGANEKRALEIEAQMERLVQTLSS